MGYLGTKPQIATSLADGTVTTSKLADGAITTTKLVDGAVTGPKTSGLATVATSGNYNDLSNKPSTGKVLQVVQAVKTDAVAMGTSDWTDIPGLTLNITPSSTSSRVFLSCFIGSVSAGGNGIVLRMVRNGTAIGVGDSSGSRDRVTIRGMREGDTNHNRFSPSFQFVDSPSSTSAVTYKIQVKNEGNGTVFINRAQTDTDISNAYGGRSIASLILTEIAA